MEALPSALLYLSGALVKNCQNGRTAKAIFEIEKQNLLDFRKSLYIAVAAISPESEEETAEQEKLMVSESQGQFRVLQYVDKDNLHIVRYEYRHPSVNKWIRAELAFDDKGRVLTGEGEEND